MKRTILLSVVLLILGLVSWPARTGAHAPTLPPTPTPTGPQLGPGAHPDIPPGYTLIEGDILVRTSFVKEHQLNPQATWTANLWPNGVVPYEFDANVTQANRTAMLQAMTDWQNVAAVSFVARTNQADYIHIQDSSGNNSPVGRQGGQQIVNIFNWNVEFIMAHELGHTLGYWHEQSRPDRDNFVQINIGNVQAGQEHNFDKHCDAAQYGPYDFDSVMHYGQCDFDIFTDCLITHTTILVKAPNQSWQTLIGQRNHLSYMDRTTMSFLYPQANWRFVEGSRPAGNGGFFSPWNNWGTAIAGTPTGGTLWIQPGSYAAVGTYSRRMTLRAPLGGVHLGQ